MFKHLKKNFFTTALNILGLSVAFAAFVIILIQVNYDLGYNKNFKDSDKIYRVEGAFNLSDMNSFAATLCRPLIFKFGECSPNIETFGDMMNQSTCNFARADKENPSYIAQQLMIMTKGTLQVFGFDIVAGDTSAFDNTHNVIISQSASKAIFGDESPLGKPLWLGGSNGGKDDRYNIIAVYKDFEDQCFIKNGIIAPFGDADMDNTSEWSYTLYVKLHDPSRADEMADLMVNELIKLYEDQTEIIDAFLKAGEESRFLRLTNVHDTHFSKDVQYDNMEKASLSTTYSLLTIAILIILIAIINFINFSMASIPLNIKGINTRKVLGETNASLRMKQIWEAITIALVSLAVGILWIYILSGTSFSSFISDSISPADNIPMILIAAAVAVFTGIAAGIYPAIYSTSFSPALVIKGSFSLSPKGRHLRTGLVALQYLISLVLIIVALFINVQSSYMKKYDMGYNSNNILTLYISESMGKRREAFESKLKENPIISDATFAQGMIISNGKMGWGRMANGRQVRFDCFPVSHDFIEFFDMKMADGRAFTPEDELKANGTYIFNEATMATYPEFHIGDKISGHNDGSPADLVGVVKDFNFQPLQYKINPIALYVFGTEPWWSLKFAYIKPAQGADIKECIKYITSVIREMDPNVREDEINISFMDERIGQLYSKEDNLGKLILIFCALSVLISIIGILGLIFFETQYKKREIGVRRVFGSSVSQILKMLNVAYIKIASICFVVSIPISIIIIKMWLKSFTYQSPIPVWIFLVAYVVILVITVLVITLQSLRAASANPVDSVRAE